MAIYHASVKSFSRGKGESSVAAAAYRAGLDLKDERTGVLHRYANRKGVVSHHMLAPKGAPSWALDPQKFWNANEAAEVRANARVAREVEVSLPSDLSEQQRETLALDLGEFLVQRYKAVVLVAIHTPSGKGDQRNHHVHLLVSARKVGSKGLGDRAGAALDARQGGGTKELRQLRKDIAGVINADLKRASVATQVDHRSLRDQARDAAFKGDFERAKSLTRHPGKHLGKSKVALSRKTEITTSLKQPGQAEAMLKFSRFVRESLTEQTDPFVHEVPASHSHDQALQDRARERGLGHANSPGVPRAPAHQAKSRLQGPTFASSKTKHGAIHTPYSGLTRHLSKVQRITRAHGRSDAEVLNAEAELIEAWLEVQRQAAQDALELLRSIPGIQVETVFQQAHAALVCRRVDAYIGRPFLFEDTETLATSMNKYAHMLTRPHRARMKLLQAQAKWVEHQDDPSTPEAMRVRQSLYRARTQVSRKMMRIHEWRTNEARKAMDLARSHLEERFAIARPEAFLPVATVEEAKPTTGEGEGGWQLKPKVPRPSM